MTRMKPVGQKMAFMSGTMLVLLLFAGSTSVAAGDQTPSGALLGSDLLTENTETAAEYYAELFGWNIKKADDGGYVAHHQDRPIASFSQIDEDNASFWLVGVAVEDVHRSVKRAAKLGATIHEPVTAVEGYGRFAVISDPQGATIMLIEPGTKPIGRTEGPGSWRWAELWTNDVAAAQEFYTEVVGYSLDTVTRDGGPYPIFVSEDKPRAGIVDIPDELETVQPGWVPYVGVEKLETSTAKVEKLGGRVVFATQEDQTDAKVGLVIDPVGAALFIYEIGSHKEVSP